MGFFHDNLNGTDIAAVLPKLNMYWCYTMILMLHLIKTVALYICNQGCLYIDIIYELIMRIL